MNPLVKLARERIDTEQRTHSEYCHKWHRECLIQRLADEVEKLEAQLPAEMKGCTIVFKQCDKGHGWLTAANWVQHECPGCVAERAAAKIRRQNEFINRAADAIDEVNLLFSERASAG